MSFRGLTVGVVLVAAMALPPGAMAHELTKRMWLGVRLGDFLPADEQKGGFRVFGGADFDGGERAVKIREVPTVAVTFGYGVAKWGRTQMSLEIQASRIDTSIRPETVYRDENASTRVPLPPRFITDSDGDEDFIRLDVGDLTLTPIFVTALFHWSGRGGRADFYAGGGPGIVLAETREAKEFRDFKSDFDGSDDLTVDDAFGVLLKTGSNVVLKRGGNWFLYFEAEFMSTGFLTSQPQVRWNGSDYFAGEQSVDTDGDNIPDQFGVPADLRIVDPGKLRVDGATIGLGLKYRFGGAKAAAAPVPGS